MFPQREHHGCMEKTCCSSGVLRARGHAELGSPILSPSPASPLSWDTFHSPRATEVPVRLSYPPKHSSLLCLSSPSSGPQTRLCLNPQGQDSSSPQIFPSGTSPSHPRGHMGCVGHGQGGTRLSNLRNEVTHESAVPVLKVTWPPTSALSNVRHLVLPGLHPATSSSQAARSSWG